MAKNVYFFLHTFLLVNVANANVELDRRQQCVYYCLTTKNKYSDSSMAVLVFVT